MFLEVRLHSILKAFVFLLLITTVNIPSVKAQGETCKPFEFNLVPGFYAGPNTFAYTPNDFNGDGFPDVALINAEARTVSVLFGDGAGGFSAPQSFPTEINPWSITSGDLDSDGKADLIAASFYENKFAILINNGSGGFSAPTIFVPPSQFPNQGQYYDLRAADFNGDGNLDIVAAQNQQNKQLRFFLGDGQGALNSTSTLNLTGDDATLAVGDLNGDNLPDLAVAGGSSFVSRYISFVYGRQDGNFSLTSGFNVVEKPVGIKIAKLDRDGDNDLAIAFEDVTTPTQHFLQPWFNNSGSFTGGTKIDVVYFLSPNDIETGDFNADGNVDLAAPLGGKLVMVNYGRGNGVFQTDAYYAVPSGSGGIMTADLNQDNKPDLTVIQKNYLPTNSISVLINNDNTGFKAPKAMLWGPQNVEAGDFNGDNYKDFVSAWNTDFNNISGVDIALNDTLGGLLPEQRTDSPAALKAMKVGDFNGDGNTDAVTAHTNNGRQLAVYLGNGAGGLAPFVSTSLNVAFENIIVGKFNADNMDDVFAIDSSGRGYSMLSNGDGTLTTAPNFPVTLQGGALKLGKGDFNGDGKLDLIISNGSVVNLWLGDGAGQFTLSSAAIPSLSDVVVGDFNGDGNLDLAGFGAGEVKGLPGDGGGNFGSAFTLPTATSNARSLISADFNGDGFSDLAYTVVLANNGNLVVVPSGGQNASWKTPVSYTVGGLDGYFTTIFAADFNNDDKPDIGYNAGSSRGVIYNTSGQSPCLSVNDATATEGDEGNATANFTVSLSAASTQDVYVNYSLAGQTATPGTDFQNASGRLKIPAGQTSANISVTVNGDVLDEFDENFVIRLASPANAALQKSEGVGTILDNDAEPTLTITDVTRAEGFSAQGFSFNVELSAPSGKPISFRYATADGTASSTRDYIAASSVLNIAPGTSSANIFITVLGDNMYELDEDFFVNLSEEVNVSLADAQGKGTMTNDDSVPTVSLFNGVVTEGDTGTVNVTVNVQLSNPTYLPVSLNVLTSDGTAVAGSDYAASDTSVTIPAEQQTATTVVQVLGDTINEPNETFNTNVYNVVNATVNIPQFTVFINDDEWVSNDFDRDGKTDLVVFRPTERVWYFNYSFSNGTNSALYGLSDDIPVTGDYNGDGRTDLAVFRPSDGTWYTPITGRTQRFGLEGDVPVHGDYDNDGKIDLAVFRPGDRTWYIQRSSNGAVDIVQWGLADDTPVPADYDGDGRADIAVFRPATGVWYILRSTDGGYSALSFGQTGDKAVPADYDGDGRADVAVFRAGVWYVFRSSDLDVTVFQWGIEGDKPVPGNYDGDSKTDFAVYRDGAWWIWLSSTDSYVTRQFGLATDIPIPFVSRN